MKISDIKRPLAGIAFFCLSIVGAATTAGAADLGGNCCADLEERIAELEATTARKGNRKVSLTISGYVAEQIAWWDDGVESNTYVEGIGGTTASHVNFLGEAKISADLTAGYLLRIRGISTSPFATDQDSGSSVGSAVNVFYSQWYLKSASLGKVSVGLLSPSSDNAAIAVDQSGSLLQANWAMFDGSAFKISNGSTYGVGGGTLRWRDVVWCSWASLGTAGDCTEQSWDGVRYDTPVWNGFSASASWGMDDFWDATLRYNGEVAGFKLAAAASYADTTSETLFGTVAHRDAEYFQTAAYAEHLATGLFGYFAYGHEWFSNTNVGGLVVDDQDHNWYAKAGFRRKDVPLGATVLYGEYGTAADMLSPAAIGLGITDADFRQWGLGVVQEIDAAAMSLWLKYRNYDVDAKVGAAKLDTDIYQTIVAGAVINF